MSKKAVIEASSLPALAKQFREASGKNRAEAARDLGVARPSVIQAEERPDINLSKLRKRIIERYSPYELVGPVFYLKKKS